MVCGASGLLPAAAVITRIITFEDSQYFSLSARTKKQQSTKVQNNDDDHEDDAGNEEITTAKNDDGHDVHIAVITDGMHRHRHSRGATAVVECWQCCSC